MADLYRVDSVITGAAISGGGIQQFYFDVGGGDPDDCVTAVKNFWTAAGAQIATGTQFVVQGLVAQVDAENGDVLLMHPGTNQTVNASGSGTIAPPEVQGVLRLRTGSYSDGREIRGRVFLPGVPAAAVASGAPHPDYVTAMQAAGAALVADATCTLVVYRRERQAYAGVGSPGMVGYRPPHDYRAGSFAAVTTTQCWSKFGVLRSRRD